MKRYKYILSGAVIAAFLAVAAPVSAQMMYGMGTSGSSSSDAEVQKGQSVYDQLQDKQTTCDKLTDDNFDVLGDFYMARMMGVAAHGAMDQRMTQYMGDTANTQVHVALAKRLSGCDSNASYPASAGNYAPVAGMTGLMSSGMMNGNWSTMGYNNSSWSGTTTLLAVLLVLAIAVAVFAWFRPGATVAKKIKK